MLDMQPVEIMRATDVIGPIGAAFYFHPDTVARGKEAGLDGFRFYILGRGGVLGDVEDRGEVLDGGGVGPEGASQGSVEVF